MDETQLDTVFNDLKLIENEVKPDLVSTGALNCFYSHNSASRLMMTFTSHLGQSLVVKDSTPRRCQSGMEKKFGEYTFNIKFPCNAQIISVIPKYREQMGGGFIKGEDNPYSVVIFENEKNKKVDILEVPSHSNAVDIKHQHFGFEYKATPNMNRVFEKAHVEEGMVIADSPNKDERGNYNYGLEAEVVNLSVPGITEDGVVVSKSFCERAKTYGFEKRVLSWGGGSFPLNLYPKNGRYGIFPDIGDEIRPDGLLFALREYDHLLGPVQMTPSALMTPDTYFDKLTYSVPGSHGLNPDTLLAYKKAGMKIRSCKVVDVHVWHNDNLKSPITPIEMEAQPRRYLDALQVFYKKILETYQTLKRNRGDNLKIGHEFHRLIDEAMSYFRLEDNPLTKNYAKKYDLHKRNIKKQFKKTTVEEWRVEVTFKYELIPDIGFKITDTHGCKGVICAVWDDADMPVDQAGNRAEIIMDGDARSKRMNIGGVYEQAYNAASRDLTKYLRGLYGVDPNLNYTMPDKTERYNYIGKLIDQWADPATHESTEKWLKTYYYICNPKMYELFNRYPVPFTEHIKQVLYDGIYLWMPTDNPVYKPMSASFIRKYMPITFGPVTYSGGNVTQTNVLIGSQYILLLEKTGTSYSGTSSAKLQHHGVLSKVSSLDKYATPARNNPVRILGIAEVLLLCAVVGSDVVVDLLDQSNNPRVHKSIIERIVKAENPTNFDSIIDRQEHPLGNSRTLQFTKHILECAGVKLSRHIDDPIRADYVEKKLKELE